MPNRLKIAYATAKEIRKEPKGYVFDRATSRALINEVAFLRQEVLMLRHIMNGRSIASHEEMNQLSKAFRDLQTLFSEDQNKPQ